MADEAKPSWDVNRAIEHLNQSSAGRHSTGNCAKFVRLAIAAGGGVPVMSTKHAKDYGPNLEAAGFHALTNVNPQAGDVAVIQPVPGHPDGHMAMYNGSIWVSDFQQQHGYYPGDTYRRVQPAVTFYRKSN